MQFYFPSVQETFHRMANKSIFSKIDLEKGFYQITLFPENYKYTAFDTQFGKFEYTRTSFGLVNAPKIFQNVLVGILGDLENLTVFVDDMLIHTSNIEQHLLLLEEIFFRFINNNILINLDKNKFLKNEINYYGFSISTNGHTPDMTRLKDFPRFKTP